ncbi:MAG: Threonine dehydratase biosynthetic [uncultured Nocardioidaceae bacterium]|uniref:L-threonine dehydratase n=1 Tax=uncultured Nocardioidaceae bacterium TaxID=253824 RepID=A0A6J4LRZ7_9ACTN|nr:MAG: Threonine dehydratase biosynthetic [uncultured Nocardioidaceae bacterium]
MSPLDGPGPAAVPDVTAADVERAAAALRGVVDPTPLERSSRLSELTGAQVLLKREDLQPTRSYKGRGAYTFISRLSEAQRAAGVVCASAGNHAQGVAFACARSGVRARIYLPRTTPRQKRDRVAALGGEHAEVFVQGDTYDDAAALAAAHAEATGATLVPAFDHPYTVAGQGTVLAEAVAQLGRPPDVVVVPVGGGGLIAGNLVWLAEHAPSVRVVGVEPAGAAGMSAAVAAGGPVDLDDLEGFVDGAAVRRVGTLTHRIVARCGPELVTVPEGQVCVEMLDLYQVDGIVAEPAGALATAVLPLLDLSAGATVVCVLSGGNNDVSRYAEVVERALVHTGRKHYFLVEFPQEPGALRRFLDEVLGPDDDITLFEYVKRNNRETGPALVGIELGRADDLDPLLDRMRKAPPRIEQIPPDSPLFRFLL